MPNGRRIIFSSYIIPTQIKEMEETAVTHEEFQANVGKTLGGKGTATINASQWSDDWTSGRHDHIDVWEDYTNNWNESLIYPNKTARIALSTSASQLSTDTNDLAFLYIKNLGSTNNALVSLNGNGVDAKYYIIIPPEGSVGMRGDDTGLECNEVFVKSNTSTTEIEYLIAKE